MIDSYLIGALIRVDVHRARRSCDGDDVSGVIRINICLAGMRTLNVQRIFIFTEP